MAGKNCDAVLIPTEEALNEDYTSAMAYVYVNAAYDYERVIKENSGSAGLGIVYEAFSLDFQQSSSAQDFQTRVRSRLVSLGYTFNSTTARSYTKRALTDAQVEAWLDCQGGGVFLSVKDIDPQRAEVRLDYEPRNGVTDHNLTLTVEGGTTSDGQVTVKENLNGAVGKTYIIRRGKGEAITRVVANVAGDSDGVALDFAAADRPKNLMGTTLNIARRSPRIDTPYDLWVPRDINVTAMAAPTRWIATNLEYMNVSVGAFTIKFEIAHESLFHYESTQQYPFDGFVITGFRYDIVDASVLNSTPLRIELARNERQIAVNLFGRSDAGKIFVVQVKF